MWPLHVWAPNAPSSQHLIKLFIRDNNKNYGDPRAKLPMLLPPPMNLKRSLKVMVCVPCCTQTDSCKGLPGSVLDFTNGFVPFVFLFWFPLNLNNKKWLESGRWHGRKSAPAHLYMYTCFTSAKLESMSHEYNKHLNTYAISKYFPYNLCVYVTGLFSERQVKSGKVNHDRGAGNFQ